MYDLLEGLRIVEGSAFVAAPLGGMALGQLGADVIRFDALEGGLDYRRWPVTDKGDSIYWAGLNKGKRSFRVDIRSPRGRELVQALITAPGPGAGIFLTNLPARGWIGYEALSAMRADLILLNVLGTRSGAPQVDYTVNASVGFPYVTGPEGWEGPVDNVLPAWDIATGMMAAAGLLAAERRRARTGEGSLSASPFSTWRSGRRPHSAMSARRSSTTTTGRASATTYTAPSGGISARPTAAMSWSACSPPATFGASPRRPISASLSAGSRRSTAQT